MDISFQPFCTLSSFISYHYFVACIESQDLRINNVFMHLGCLIFALLGSLVDFTIWIVVSCSVYFRGSQGEREEKQVNVEDWMAGNTCGHIYTWCWILRCLASIQSNGEQWVCLSGSLTWRQYWRTKYNLIFVASEVLVSYLWCSAWPWRLYMVSPYAFKDIFLQLKQFEQLWCLGLQVGVPDTKAADITIEGRLGPGMTICVYLETEVPKSLVVDHYFSEIKRKTEHQHKVMRT